MSDKSDEYLKMVLALPSSFFDGWEWRAGDKFIAFIAKTDIYSIHSLGNCEIVKSETRSFPPKFVYTYPNIKTEIRGDIRPILSQEQLQEKCLNFANTAYTWKSPRTHRWLFTTFLDWIHDHYDDVHGLDGNCIWLMVTMDGVYNKKWNGSSWV